MQEGQAALQRAQYQLVAQPAEKNGLYFGTTCGLKRIELLISCMFASKQDWKFCGQLSNFFEKASSTRLESPLNSQLCST